MVALDILKELAPGPLEELESRPTFAKYILNVGLTPVLLASTHSRREICRFSFHGWSLEPSGSAVAEWLAWYELTINSLVTNVSWYP